MANDNKRSAFSLNFPEIAFASVIALLAWFGVRSFLSSLLPFPCGSSIENIPIACGWTEAEAWQTLGLPLFSKYAVWLVMLNALAGIFLVRFIRRDVQDFSLLGSLALAWPLLTTLGIHLIWYFGLCILPIGFLLGILATITSQEEKRYRFDWISLPVSFVSMIVSGMYLHELLGLYSF